MTLENVKRLYLHFSKLSDGNFKARDFDFVLPGKNDGDEEGRSAMGKLSPQRIDLIKSDALVCKLQIEEKYPNIKKLCSVKEEVEEA